MIYYNTTLHVLLVLVFNAQPKMLILNEKMKRYSAIKKVQYPATGDNIDYYI